MARHAFLGISKANRQGKPAAANYGKVISRINMRRKALARLLLTMKRFLFLLTLLFLFPASAAAESDTSKALSIHAQSVDVFKRLELSDAGYKQLGDDLVFAAQVKAKIESLADAAYEEGDENIDPVGLYVELYYILEKEMLRIAATDRSARKLKEVRWLYKKSREITSLPIARALRMQARLIMFYRRGADVSFQKMFYNIKEDTTYGDLEATINKAGSTNWHKSAFPRKAEKVIARGARALRGVTKGQREKFQISPLQWILEY